MPTCPLCHGEVGHLSNPLDHLKACPAVDANRHRDESATPFLEATNPAESGIANSQGDFTFGYIMGGVYALGAVWSLVYGMRVGSDAHRDVMIALLVFLVAHITAQCHSSSDESGGRMELAHD
jgi:hypothetical protein